MAYYRASAGPPTGMGLRLAGAMAQQVAHLLCKQGVRGSSPLGSTLVSGTFATRRNCERHEYSSKVQQRCRRVVMLSGLRAARRAPSTLSKSSRWSLGCIHPLSSRSGCGAVSAWPPAGGHQGRRAKMRRPCAWLAPSSWARQPVYTGSGKRGRSCEDRPACQVCRDHQTRLVPSLSLGPESPLEFEPNLQSANADFRNRQGRIGCRRLGLPPKQAARDTL
jgi:hypothetical protein